MPQPPSRRKIRPPDQGSGRVALVIGNAAYPARPLAIAVNDAGLVAEMVRNAGYDLVEARDVDEAGLRQAVRDFLDRVAAAGPDAVAFVYLSGYGLQLEGENYFAPVSARLARVTDIPTETLRVGDLMRSLAGLNVAARIVVLDMGREHPFLGGARAVPTGLALVEPGEGTLVAFSTGPGEMMREGGGPYGVYAAALVEMATKPGLPLDQLFTQVRLRVHDASRGVVTPWHLSRITAPVLFFEGEAVADDSVAPPQLAELDPQAQQLLARPLNTLSPDQAYSVALERDTIAAYQEFLAAFADHPLARRVRLLLAERREALIWRRTVVSGTPEAYWSYLRRYPRGPHAFEARRRLTALTASPEPPPGFAIVDEGIPPPPPDEVNFFEAYYEAYYADPPPDYAPPPPFPVYLLPPMEPAFVSLPPPVYYQGVVFLPVPGPIVMRRSIRPARPIYLFRRGRGPDVDRRRRFDRPVITRFGGRAPIRQGGPQPRIQPGTMQPAVQPRIVQPDMRPELRKQRLDQPQFKQLPKSPTDERLEKRRTFDQQRDRGSQQQQQKSTIQIQPQPRVIQQQPEPRIIQQPSPQPRAIQPQPQPRIIQQPQPQPRMIQQQPPPQVIQQPQQRVIQQQPQQRVIQQQPQQRAPQPNCPRGINFNGTCK